MGGRSIRPISRRRFLRGTGVGLAGLSATALLGCGKDDDGVSLADGDGPLEVTRLRLAASNQIFCSAPFFFAISLLKEEGFTDVEVVPWTGVEYLQLMKDGAIDFDYDFAGSSVARLDVRDPMTVLGGMHTGCYQLIGREGLTAIGDVRKVAVLLGDDPLQSDRLFMAQILYSIGFDPDERMVSTTEERIGSQMASGEVDAILATPPSTHHLRQQGYTNVLIDSAEDAPFAQYFCCLVVGHNDFIRRYPAATKRFLRAVMRATDIAASDPERAVRYLVDEGHLSSFDESMAEMSHVKYDVWRRYDLNDTLRFNALRLREGGFINSTPDDILKRGVNLRYFNELRQEMAAVPRFGTGQRSAFDPNCDIPGLPLALSIPAGLGSIGRTRDQGAES